MSQRGFTLIELLLAITLLSMIMAMAYQGVRVGTRSVDKGEELVDRTNRLRVVHQFLRKQISRAMPLAMRSDEDDENLFVIFEGDRETMRFVAPMPGYLGHGGPHEQYLAIERGRNGYELLFGYRLLHSEDDTDPLADPDRPPTLLMDGIKDAEFEYLTLDDEGNPTEWVSEWEDPSISPVMVRIHIEMERETRLVWPTLEVAPLIDGSAARRNITTNARPTPTTRRRNVQEQ